MKKKLLFALVLLLVVCYACNTANPMRTGSWIPFLD